MCKVSELNKRSRGLARSQANNYDDARRKAGIFLCKIADKIKDSDENKQKLIELIAFNQMVVLMMCEASGISDKEVLEAGCENFDKYIDKVES